MERERLARWIVAASALAVAAPAPGAGAAEGAAAAKEAGAAATDAAAAAGGSAATGARQRIVLPAAARDQVLEEMRIMLASLQDILRALANDNPEAVARAARASGMAAAVDVDPKIRDKLPDAFLSLGVATHQSFDELAARVEKGATEEGVLRSLAGLTSNCVACHEAYRIDEAR